ncbi:MAG: M28 family peptidase, partial [Oscillospiraceae bacterium]|nr:M28 family peptidase [Oscillospiraceae bacterium]
MELVKILDRLCSIPTVSGNEDKLLKVLSKILPESLEISLDNIKNIHIKGGEGDKKILLDAHCDQIGFIVTDFCDNGFLRVAPVGGIDVRTLLGARLKVFGKEELVGVFSSVPPHLQKDGDANKFPAIEELAVDIGLPLVTAKELVSLGDTAIIENTPIMLSQNRYCAAGLDNKAGCAVMLYVMERLFNSPLLKNTSVELVLSSQEELGMRGACAVSRKEEFDKVISIDASFADFPGCPQDSVGVLAKGPMLGHSPVLSKAFTQELSCLAEKLLIPMQHEVMGRSTGTNADVLSLASGGVDCALISLPLRNMH